MELRKKLIQNTWLALRGNWGKAVVITFTHFGAGLVGYLLWLCAGALALPLSAAMLRAGLSPAVADLIVGGVIALLLFLGYAPLLLGTMRFFGRVAAGGDVPVAEAFAFYSKGRYAAALSAVARAALCMVLSAAVLGAPGAILSGLGYTMMMNLLSAASPFGVALLLCGILLSFLSAMMALVTVWRVFLSLFSLAEDIERSLWRAVMTAVRGTAGMKAEIVLYSAALALFGLMSFLIFPVFFVLPFFMTLCGILSHLATERMKIADDHG